MVEKARVQVMDILEKYLLNAYHRALRDRDYAIAVLKQRANKELPDSTPANALFLELLQKTVVDDNIAISDVKEFSLKSHLRFWEAIDRFWNNQSLKPTDPVRVGCMLIFVKSLANGKW